MILLSVLLKIKIIPFQELPDGGYKERTLKNVQDSDATVIIYFESISRGTEKTLLYCLNEKKPYLLIDGSGITQDSLLLMSLEGV